MFQESRGVVDSKVGLVIRKKLIAQSLEILHSPIHKVMRLRRENQEVYEMGKVQMCLFKEQVIISCECGFSQYYRTPRSVSRCKDTGV